MIKPFEIVSRLGRLVETSKDVNFDRRTFLQFATLAVPAVASQNQFTRNDERRILDARKIADYHLKNGRSGTNKFRKSFFDTSLGNGLGEYGISGHYSLDELDSSSNKLYQSEFGVEVYDGKKKIYGAIFRSFFEDEGDKVKPLVDCRKVLDTTGKFETVTVYDYDKRRAFMRTIDGKYYIYNVPLSPNTEGFWSLVARGVYFKNILSGRYPSVISTGSNLFSRDVEVKKTDDEIKYLFSADVDGKNESFTFSYNTNGNFSVKMPGMPMEKELK